MKIFTKIVFILMYICILNTVYAIEKSSKPINILTWWGYLNKPWVGDYIKKECGETISFDEYYTNEEFNKLWALHKTNYDIVIFEDTFYNIIGEALKNKGTNISSLAKGYYPLIRERFFQKKYPKNILYFFQSTTGFLWNPKIINLNPNNSINSIFQSAGNHMVVLLDDPAVMITLFNEAYHDKSKLNVNDFFNLIKNSNIYIANDYNKVYENKNFAFSYIWSGEGIFDLVTAGDKYQFTINPKLSYVSSDLIAQISHSSQSSCVVKTLASKEFLAKLQNNVYYFSPYGDTSKIKPASYKKIYSYYLNHLSQLKWIDSIPANQFEDANQSWKLVKLRFMQ